MKKYFNFGLVIMKENSFLFQKKSTLISKRLGVKSRLKTLKLINHFGSVNNAKNIA